MDSSDRSMRRLGTDRFVRVAQTSGGLSRTTFLLEEASARLFEQLGHSCARQHNDAAEQQEFDGRTNMGIGIDYY